MKGHINFQQALQTIFSKYEVKIMQIYRPKRMHLKQYSQISVGMKSLQVIESAKNSFHGHYRLFTAKARSILCMKN